MAGVQRPGRLSLERSRSDDLGTFRERTCHASCNPSPMRRRGLPDPTAFPPLSTHQSAVFIVKMIYSGSAKPNGRLRGTLCAVRHGFLSRVHGFQRKARRIRWHFQPRRRRRSTRSTVASTPVKLARRGFWNGNGMPGPNEPLRCRFSGIQKAGKRR
jgi:hypothetical protein